MKNSCYFIFFLLAYYTSVHGQQVIHSGKKNISVIINGSLSNCSISPERDPDRLLVYCSIEKNEVVFKTDIDTAILSISKNDTIKLEIILNLKDTAHTEIIGVKDLPDKIPSEEKQYWLSQVWSETKYNFVNIDKLKFNLDSLYKTYIPKVLATENDFEYYRVLQNFLASLNDAHSQVVDNGQFYPYTDYIPMSLKDFNKKVYITRVRKTPELDSTWVGAELIEIENIPTKKFLETKIFPFISASTEQHLWMQGIAKIQSGLKWQSFYATIKKVDGKVIKINVQRNGETTRTDKDQYWGPSFNNSRNIVDLKWMDNNIALVSFNRFSPEEKAIKEFDKISKELDKAKGVIIDLRNNGGGSAVVALHLQKYLTKEDYFLNYAWETRTNDGVRKANGNWKDEYKSYYLNQAYRFEMPDTISVSDTIKRIMCPTAILIGRFTFSAAEDFLVNIFEVPKRPILIGEETGGSTGSPLVVSGLPGGGYARICTRRICYPISGKRFVNSGVKPDIEVKQAINDYLANKDVVLEKAFKEISEVMK